MLKRKNKQIVLLLGTLWIIANSSFAIDYTYDDQNRIIKVQYSADYSITYTYDKVGNRTGLVSVGKAVSISGNTGIGEVLLDGLPDNPSSDINGDYSVFVEYGWSGTVTPVKAGYSFTPNNRTYTNVTEDQENQDYTALITISGNTDVGDVLLSGLPNNPSSDINGNYTVAVEYGWSGTVTPEKIGYNFTPNSITYTNVTVSQDNQDYTAWVTISGNTDVGDVLLSGLPDNPSSDINGDYSVEVEYGWSGTVTPIKNGYDFYPISRSYTDVVENYKNQDYTAISWFFTISGNTDVGEVVLSGLPENPTSDINGDYSVEVHYSWSGTVTPVKAGYNFTPINRTYTNVIENQDNQDYTAWITISGNTGVGDVFLNGLPGNPSSDINGDYSVAVEYGWSGTVTPEKVGYNFTPNCRIYTNITVAQDNQDYTAWITISGNTDAGEVLLSGLPGNPSSDINGDYSVAVEYGWSGTVIPEKVGYNFSPSSRTYTNLIVAQDNQDYTAWITISGNTEVGDVLLDGLPDNPYSNSNGDYSVAVELRLEWYCDTDKGGR